MNKLNLIVEVEYDGSTGPLTQDDVRRGVADELNAAIDNGFGDGTGSFVIERISVSIPAHAADCANRFHSAAECTCGYVSDEEEEDAAMVAANNLSPAALVEAAKEAIALDRSRDDAGAADPRNDRED